LKSYKDGLDEGDILDELSGDVGEFASPWEYVESKTTTVRIGCRCSEADVGTRP